MKPVLQALVLADHAYQDLSGKKIIVGTFSAIKFSKKPPVAEVVGPDGTKRKVLMGGAQSGSPFVYLSLTDVCDGTTIQVEFVNLTKNLVLFNTAFSVNNSDRLAHVEVILPLPALPISEAGAYAVQAVWQGEILGSWRIVAEDLDAKREDRGHGSSI